MCKIAPPSNIVHFPEAERHRKSRSHHSSLEKRATGHSVGITVDGEFTQPYVVSLKFKNETETERMYGRKGWALRLLYDAGEKGVSPTDFPAPRWSSYVFDLRQMGLDIETVRQPQWGSYSSTLTRYVLRSDVVVLPIIPAAAT